MGLAAVAAHSGEYDRGALLLGVVTRLRDANGLARDPLEQELHDQIREQLQAVLSDQRLEQLLEEGMVMSIDAVIQFSSRIST